MVRLPRTGASICAIYERTPAVEAMVERGYIDPNECVTTLGEVITDLGLKALSSDDEQRIRNELAPVIGSGLSDIQYSPKLNPDGRLQVSDVQATLKDVAASLDAMIAGQLSTSRLDAITKVLSGAQTGCRESHDIAVALAVRKTLASEGLDADAKLMEFRQWPRTIAEACRRAARDLDPLKGKSGRPSRDWYRDFERVLAFVASKNGISRQVVINRRTGKAQGRYVDLAEGFEDLLPRLLRSPSREAIAKSLQRAREPAKRRGNRAARH
jgi:hypothetical protein